MKPILLGAAAILALSLGLSACDPAKSAEPEHRHDGGVGVHIGPNGAGARVGPGHISVGVDGPSRWHHGYRTHYRPHGIVIGDPCWRQERTIYGWDWVYVCD